MNWKAKGYFGIMLLGGFSIVAGLPFSWSTQDPIRFSAYLLLTVIASFWKIYLPGIRGTMSANFLLVLIAALQLSESETLAIALSGALTQSLFKSKSKGWERLLQCAFNLASVAIAIRITMVFQAIAVPVFPGLAFSLRLVMTAVMYFIFNTLPVSAIASLTEERSLMTTWKTCFFWSFPFYILGAMAAGVVGKAAEITDWQTAILIVPFAYLMFRSYELYLGRLNVEKRQVELERNHAEEMASLHLRTIQALALAIAAKDRATPDQLQRVQHYCAEIGRAMRLSSREMKALKAASLLHDIGKLAVPEHIVSKPGRLTPEEFEKMKSHPVVGAEILEHVKFPYPVVPMVRHHHEKWDGSGYPDGLSGTEIPIGARILSAVSAFDALSSERQYRPALPASQAMDVLRGEAGRSYDPNVVEILERCYLALETGRETATGVAEQMESLTVAPVEPAEFLSSIAAARHEAQFLRAISETMTVAKDPQGLITALARQLGPMIPFDTIAYFQSGSQILRPLHVLGEEKELFLRLSIPLGQGVSGWVGESRKSIRNGNPAVETACLGDRAVITSLRSALAVPVEGANGIIGVLSLYSKSREAFTKDHLRILMAASSRLAYPLENLRRVQKAEDDATTDELTRLPNSRRLLHELKAACLTAQETGGRLSVVVIDLDGFKSLNDTYGHLRGNRVLQEIAARAARVLGRSALLARMGGDEFVLVLPGSGEREAAAEATQVQRLVEEAGVSAVGTAILSASWGVAVFGRDGKTPDSLVAEADRRMYLHKASKDQRMAARLAHLARSLKGASDSADYVAQVIDDGR